MSWTKIVPTLLLTIIYAHSFLATAFQTNKISFHASPIQRHLKLRPFLSTSTSFNEKRNVSSFTKTFMTKNIQDVEIQSMNQSQNILQSRYITKVEKYSRLPVWPVWNGVFIFLLSKIFGNELASKVENSIGGRVCPNFFQPDQKSSPFIMLVHHVHSFTPYDPLRFIQSTFFPEGFPSHPHRGFITVTYCLNGGMVHRDSMGVKQIYGAEKRHGGKHTQWLHTGAGLLHEEMWDIQSQNIFDSSKQELYQLWLNVPSYDKLTSPKIELLGGENSTPTIEKSNTKTIVICGEYDGTSASVETSSDVTILHVQMDSGSTWHHKASATHETVILYLRQGSISMKGYDIDTDNVEENMILETHSTAYLSPQGDDLTITCHSKDIKADFLLLLGAPLDEPISAQGSMVMNSPTEINRAYADYQRGEMGAPWDQALSDEEWKLHTQKYPSRYSL